MASGPITSWQIGGKNRFDCDRFYFLGLQNYCGQWLQPWQYKNLAPGKESYDKHKQRLKIETSACWQRSFASQSYGFSSSHVWIWVKVKVKLAQSCLTLCNPMDYSLSGSSVHGILQARILEWVAFPFSRGSSQSRNQTQVSCIEGGFFTNSKYWYIAIWLPQMETLSKEEGRLGYPSRSTSNLVWRWLWQ